MAFYYCVHAVVWSRIEGGICEPLWHVFCQADHCDDAHHKAHQPTENLISYSSLRPARIAMCGETICRFGNIVSFFLLYCWINDMFHSKTSVPLERANWVLLFTALGQVASTALSTT